MRSGLDIAELSQIPSCPLAPSKMWPCLLHATSPPTDYPPAPLSPHTQMCSVHCGAQELTLALFHLQNEVRTAWVEQAHWEPTQLLPSIISNHSSVLGKLPRLPSLLCLAFNVLATWASLQNVGSLPLRCQCSLGTQ